MKMISFKVSKPDCALIDRIAQRAYDSKPDVQSHMEWSMDITACHANGCPLRLAELLKADDLDFVHDVFGIRRHIDRKTGKLGDCFLPRFADLTD